MDDITIFCEEVDNINVIGEDSLEVTLSNIDISQIISEVGVDSILEHIDRAEVEEYYKESEELENG